MRSSERTIKEHLKKLEESLLTEAVRKNSDLLSSLFAEEFREFGSSGRSFSKAAMIALLDEESAGGLSLKNFEISLLSEHVVLATYRAIRKVPGHPDSTSLRSSIWVLRGTRWQMLFHQGTRIP